MGAKTATASEVSEEVVDETMGIHENGLASGRRLRTTADNANRIALTAVSNRTNEDSVDSASTVSLTYTTAGRQLDRPADTRANLSVGDYITFSETITDADVRSFAEASGDTNGLHRDEEFAKKTRLAHRVAHETLVSGLISAALARLPETVVCPSQDTSFLESVHDGGMLTAKCRIVEELDEDKYRLAMTIRNRNGDSVRDTNAIVLVGLLLTESVES